MLLKWNWKMYSLQQSRKFDSIVFEIVISSVIKFRSPQFCLRRRVKSIEDSKNKFQYRPVLWRLIRASGTSVRPLFSPRYFDRFVRIGHWQTLHHFIPENNRYQEQKTEEDWGPQIFHGDYEIFLQLNFCIEKENNFQKSWELPSTLREFGFDWNDWRNRPTESCN